LGRSYSKRSAAVIGRLLPAKLQRGGAKLAAGNIDRCFAIAPTTRRHRVGRWRFGATGGNANCDSALRKALLDNLSMFG
jgi:hypothetical protein